MRTGPWNPCSAPCGSRASIFTSALIGRLAEGAVQQAVGVLLVALPPAAPTGHREHCGKHRQEQRERASKVGDRVLGAHGSGIGADTSEGPPPLRNLGAPCAFGVPMSRSVISLTAGAAVLVALLAAPPARAGDARAAPSASCPWAPPPAWARSQRARHRHARASPRASASGPAIGAPAARWPRRSRPLGRRAASRARAFVSYRDLYARARRTRKRLDGARGRELGAVLATLEAIALRDELTSSRMKALFLILKRNVEFWPRRPFPRDRDRVTFRGSQLVFEYYRGRGLQLQPLVNFKKANLMHAACVRDTGEPCERRGLARLLDEMAKVSARRGGFRAWEYYFDFGGGRPPWVSGMAQATGVQALGRSAELLGDTRLLRICPRGAGSVQDRRLRSGSQRGGRSAAPTTCSTRSRPGSTSSTPSSSR